MIKEDVMIKIIQAYFEREKIKAHRQEVAPDFLLDGKACEVKGSDSEFRSALNQFFSYAQKYNGLITAFPTDFLSASSRLFEFHLFVSLASALFQRSIEVILVSEHESFYYLRKVSYGHILLGDVVNNIVNEKRSMGETLQHIGDLTQKALLKLVMEKPDMTLFKPSIEKEARPS